MYFIQRHIHTMSKLLVLFYHTKIKQFKYIFRAPTEFEFMWFWSVSPIILEKFIDGSTVPPQMEYRKKRKKVDVSVHSLWSKACMDAYTHITDGYTHKRFKCFWKTWGPDARCVLLQLFHRYSIVCSFRIPLLSICAGVSCFYLIRSSLFSFSSILIFVHL